MFVDVDRTLGHEDDFKFVVNAFWRRVGVEGGLNEPLLRTIASMYATGEAKDASRGDDGRSELHKI